MGKKRKQLSHEELWDDSGLIRAWDESYEEYKASYIDNQATHGADLFTAVPEHRGSGREN